MEFLRSIFGDRALSFEEFVQAIDAHNGNEANKAAQIKLGNLGSGEYVGKGKYDAIVEELTGVKGERDKANGLIEELKKGTKGNEELQNKINIYETVTIPEMQKKMQEIKINAALKVALLAEKAIDVGYLTYKVNENMRAEGKTLELDENENIKGVADLISALKTQHPTQFEASGTRKIVGDTKLPDGDKTPMTVTKEQFAKMGYNDRLKLKQENEPLFRQLAKN